MSGDEPANQIVDPHISLFGRPYKALCAPEIWLRQANLSTATRTFGTNPLSVIPVLMDAPRHHFMAARASPAIGIWRPCGARTPGLMLAGGLTPGQQPGSNPAPSVRSRLTLPGRRKPAGTLKTMPVSGCFINNEGR